MNDISETSCVGLESYRTQALFAIGGHARMRWVGSSLATTIEHMPFSAGGQQYIDIGHKVTMYRYEWASPDGHYLWQGYLGYDRERDTMYLSWQEVLR